MGFDPSRVRRGEAIAGTGALALLVLMFVLRWYGPRADGARPVAAVDGWEAFTVWRWVALIAALTAFCLVFAQATRRAPALPASLSVALTVLALIVMLWLGVRVLFDHPPHQRAGAALGLLSTVALFCGACLSLRQEGIAERDEPHAIPVVPLQ